MHHYHEVTTKDLPNGVECMVQLHMITSIVHYKNIILHVLFLACSRDQCDVQGWINCHVFLSQCHPSLSLSSLPFPLALLPLFLAPMPLSLTSLLSSLGLVHFRHMRYLNWCLILSKFTNKILAWE